MSTTLTLVGVQSAIDALNRLESQTRLLGMRIAINAAMSPVKKQAVATAPELSGLTRNSVRIKVKVPASSFNPKHHTKPAYGLVGPGRGIVAFQSVTKTGRLGRVSAKTDKAAAKAAASGRGFVLFNRTKKLTAKRSSRYAHFLEKGRNGRGAMHWLSNAGNAASSAAHAAFATHISAAIKKAAAELHYTQQQRAKGNTGITIGTP